MEMVCSRVPKSVMMATYNLTTGALIIAKSNLMLNAIPLELNVKLGRVCYLMILTTLI